MGVYVYVGWVWGGLGVGGSEGVGHPRTPLFFCVKVPGRVARVCASLPPALSPLFHYLHANAGVSAVHIPGCAGLLSSTTVYVERCPALCTCPSCTGGTCWWSAGLQCTACTRMWPLPRGLPGAPPPAVPCGMLQTQGEGVAAVVVGVCRAAGPGVHCRWLRWTLSLRSTPRCVP